MVKDNLPLYTIGIAAKLIDVCPATLRLWEKKKLIKPSRIGKERFYSKLDVMRLEKIRSLLHKKGLNIAGVKSLLESRSCWEIKGCSSKEKSACPVYKIYA